MLFRSTYKKYICRTCPLLCPGNHHASRRPSPPSARAAASCARAPRRRGSAPGVRGGRGVWRARGGAPRHWRTPSRSAAPSRRSSSSFTTRRSVTRERRRVQLARAPPRLFLPPVPPGAPTRPSPMAAPASGRLGSSIARGGRGGGGRRGGGRGGGGLAILTTINNSIDR